MFSLDGMTQRIVLCLLLLLSACKADAPPRTSKVVELPSGKSVRVYSIQRITFGDNSHPPSLLLRYETQHPVQDSSELRDEVREVWELLRPMADKAGDAYAMVKANEPIRGVVAQTQGFTYGFIKAEDGKWQMREPKSK